MKKRKLGNTQIQVSPICLGTMTFGEQNTEGEAHSQLDYAVSRGINFIDTAEMYPVRTTAQTYTLTEQYVGRWIKRQARDTLVVATKVAGPSRGMDWVRNGQLDAQNIRQAIDASLKRLQTDYVDLYQIHWPARNVPVFGQTFFDPAKEREAASLEEQLRTLDELVRAGKIRHVGVSNETPYGVMEFLSLARQHGLPTIATIQNPYNLVNRTFEEGLDEVSFRTGVGLLAYSPLAFGQLSGKYIDNPDAVGRLNIFGKDWSPRYLRGKAVEATRRYRDIARANGMTPAQMALAWCYSRWFVNSTIIGATSLEQLKENIDAYAVQLDDGVVAAIQAVHGDLRSPAQ
jgi:aryl-alcohol dehydrogenase-like predicted oxidoreductase